MIVGWPSLTHFIPIDGENKGKTNKGSSKHKYKYHIDPIDPAGRLYLRKEEHYIWSPKCSESATAKIPLILTVLHSECPKLHRVLAALSAIGLRY